MSYNTAKQLRKTEQYFIFIILQNKGLKVNWQRQNSFLTFRDISECQHIDLKIRK